MSSLPNSNATPHCSKRTISTPLPARPRRLCLRPNNVFVLSRLQLQSIKPRMTTVVRNSDNPQLLEQLKSTLLNLELKRTELLTKYEPTYPLVQEVDQQIADAKRAISARREQTNSR